MHGSVSASGCHSPGRLGPRWGQGRACTREAKVFSSTHRTQVFADGREGKNRVGPQEDGQGLGGNPSQQPYKRKRSGK
jgi:hypothetical protein